MLAGFALALTGCYESTEVTLHQPHVYKGKVDARDIPPDHKERLAERFRQVQTDR